MRPFPLLASILVLLASVGLEATEIDVEYSEYQVDGLSAPAEIVVDRWGVPHIYAAAHYDAFFVQGFNAARDRLWQIDLWRRRGLGELAEVLGPEYVEQDAAARLFLYRGSMFREWLAYGSDAKRIAEAFTAGINAYVRHVETHPDALPIEFQLLDYAPSLWEADDVVRIRSHGLWRNVTSEVQRARTVCEYGLETDAMRRRLEPAWETKIPEGLDPCDIPEDVLRKYRLAKAPVSFAALDEAALADVDVAAREAGSNNWAIAPHRTSTGRPILANDPHRGHAVPSLRYIAHLSAPGLDVIGAGEPALPGISIGHNGSIAFGLTIFSIDQEDLRVYDVRRGRYRYLDDWVDFETIEETIAVRDARPEKVELEFTRHGPVVHREGNRAFAVQAAMLEPGMAPYFGSVEYMRAQNWREFVAALNRWGAPAENQVYADDRGNIGYKPAGLTPIRPDFDGLMPVPGDGRFEWAGFYDMDRLPVEYNPERGWVATANAMSLPDGYPYEEIKSGFEWASPWRIDRIEEVLNASPPHSIEDSLALQRDYLSIPARRIIRSLEGEDLPAPASGLFDGWDFTLTRDSAAAALFEVWWSRYLKDAVMARLVDAPVESLGYLDPLVVIEGFEGMTPAERGEIARESLGGAIETTRSLLGEAPDAWRWGALHQMRFEHPLLDVVTDTAVREHLSMPAVERGGSGDTPNATRYREDFTVAAGGSWRMVIDVGNWDNAFMTSAPGQSGDPASPHYDDLLEGWGDDGHFPLLYSKEAVAEHAVARIRLEPREDQ